MYQLKPFSKTVQRCFAPAHLVFKYLKTLFKSPYSSHWDFNITYSQNRGGVFDLLIGCFSQRAKQINGALGDFLFVS
jgi:hypothetical protein